MNRFSNGLAEQRLKTNMTRVEDVVAIHLEGEMDFYSVRLLESRLKKLIDAGIDRIVIDVHKLSYLDTSGLGLLTNTHTQLREVGGALVCLPPEKKDVRRVFLQAPSSDMLVFADDLASAVEEIKQIADQYELEGTQLGA